MAIVQLENVEKSYGNFEVLKGLSLEVNQGEIYGLLGPNGAGKTTLFQTVVGLLKADGGKIIIDGEPHDQSKEIREKIGYLPSDISFYGGKTAVENLEFLASLTEEQPDIEALIELVGLEDSKNRKVGGFSTGMKKRLGIAQSLIKDPEILIYDEPTTGLDPEGKRKFRKHVEKVNQNRGKTVVVSSHVTKEISPLCDRFGFLCEGVIKASGTEKELCNTDKEKKVKISAENTDKLEQVLKNYSYTIDKDTVEVKLGGSTKKQILKELLDKNIDLESFEIERETLEDVYMRLTS